MQSSLDLVWTVEVSNEDLKTRDDSVREARTDLTAAWDMFKMLFDHSDLRALNSLPRGNTASTAESRDQQSEIHGVLGEWMREIDLPRRNGAPRFFDNRENSLLDQLPRLIELKRDAKPRNYLAMGSGFFESSAEPGKVPTVLQKIVGALRTHGSLTNRPKIDVFVNPLGCQAVAGSMDAMKAAGWCVRAPGIPEFFRSGQRFLHAKFIFSASYRDDSNRCNSAWVYLGSGNLTQPGFVLKMSRDGGNLEAGVVFAPETLFWDQARDTARKEVVTQLLPIQWDEELGEESAPLIAGSDMPDPVVSYADPPVAYFLWVVEFDQAWLQSPESPQKEFEVLDENDRPCQIQSDSRFLWAGIRPRDVRVRWFEGDLEYQVSVPLIDEFGRVAATALPRIDVEQAWIQLANFPLSPDEEDLVSDDAIGAMDGLSQSFRNQASVGSYPVRQIMQLVESIAEKQVSIPEDDWQLWCARLEQCLTQASGCAVLREFLRLKLNPLSPLWCEPFRPQYAEDGETDHGRRYEQVLLRIESEWGVNQLPSIGPSGDQQ